MLKHAKEYWYAYAVGLILLLEIFFWFSPLHENSINAVYLWPFAWCILTVLIVTRYQQLPKTAFVLIGLVFWFLLTNVFNGDPYLAVNQKFMIGVLLTFGIMFPTISSVSIPHQEKAFKGILIAFASGVMVVVFLSLYSVLTNTLIYSPFADNPIGLNSDARLWTFQYHANESASTFVTAFCAIVYLALCSKRKWVKVLSVPLGLSIYFAISTTVSRTGMIVFSLGAAALVYVLLFHCFSQKQTVLRAVLQSAPIALVCAVLLFFSFTSATEWMASLNEQAQIKEQTQTVDSALPLGITSAKAETVDETTVVVSQNLETRDIIEDLSTFTARDELWLGGFTYLKNRPITLLIGQLDSIVARIPQTLLGRTEFHLHSVFIETLVLAGIPGLLLYLIFFVSVCISAFRLIFGVGVSIAKRFLGFVPLIFFVNSLVEIHPAYQCDPLDMICFFFCGAVVAFSISHQKTALQAK